MAEPQTLRALSDDMRTGGEALSLLGDHLRNHRKAPVYYDTLSKCVINGQMVFCGTWSWWAFFGGPFYFFYRKMYVPGLITAASMLLLIVVRIPFAFFLLTVASAITAKYLYCRKFVSDLGVAGYPNKPRGDVTHYLTRLGGSNTWAVVLGALLYAFVVAAVIYIILAVILVTAFADIS